MASDVARICEVRPSAGLYLPNMKMIIFRDSSTKRILHAKSSGTWLLMRFHAALTDALTLSFRLSSGMSAASTPRSTQTASRPALNVMADASASWTRTSLAIWTWRRCVRECVCVVIAGVSERLSSLHFGFQLVAAQC
jgi:hypothetical protein